MSLDDCYQVNAGQALLIPGGGTGNNGQCAQWADTVLHDVFGYDYIYTPAALDWYLNAEELGLTRYFDRVNDRTIKKGDFIIFGSGVGSMYGHIDAAAQDGTYSSFVAYDSNWGGKAYYNSEGYPILHTVNHNDRYNQYIIGVLRLKDQGDDMSKQSLTDAEARRLLSLSTLLAQPGTLPDRQPTKQEVENLIGRELIDACDQLMTYTPWQQNWNKVKHYDIDVNGDAGVKPYTGPQLFTKG